MNNELIFLNGKKMKAGTMYCVASNYSGHAKEMNSFIPEQPAIFIKPPAAYVADCGVVKPPAFSNLVHHEVELVVVISKHCENIKKEDARHYIAGYAVGIDVTLRDVQNKAKENKKPWAVSKGFATSAPISKVIPVESIEDLNPVFELELTVNGQLRQHGSTSQMERTFAELIEFISSVFTLDEGDCIFTGTPEGVGEICNGDIVYAGLSGLTSIRVTVLKP